MIRNTGYRMFPDDGKVNVLHFEVASSRGEIKILPKVLDLGPFSLNGSVDYPKHSKMLS